MAMRHAFSIGTEKTEEDVKIREQWRNALALLGAGRKEETAQRKTVALPSVLAPYSFPTRALPKPTPGNLRKFAETPLVRRAINLIKDRVASMDWQVRLKRCLLYTSRCV